MSDLEFLPADADFIFVQAPITIDLLKSILVGIESTADVHPVDPSYPTNSWVTHLYSAVTDKDQQGYAILYDVPPVGDVGARPVQVKAVTGATEALKAQRASKLIGRGNELIGYEDVAGPTRVVVFRDALVVPPPPGTPGKLSWDTTDHPERAAWTAKLLELINQSRAEFEKGNPENFVAGYAGLTAPMQLKYWAELVVAMAKFESSWTPTEVFAEPPPLGVNSIGLLQLSLKDQNTAAYHLQPRIAAEGELKEPLLNLGWGITILAYWLNKDGVVASGSGTSSRGGARYWSVLRAGHKLELIKALTKKNTGL